MAAIGMMIGGAAVNALAFTGGNYLFSMLGSKSGEAEKERKRHDLAIEQLQQAEFEYQHKRRLRLDYLNKQLRDEEHSALVFEDVDAAARENLYFHPQHSFAIYISQVNLRVGVEGRPTLCGH